MREVVETLCMHYCMCPYVMQYCLSREKNYSVLSIFLSKAFFCIKMQIKKFKSFVETRMKPTLLGFVCVISIVLMSLLLTLKSLLSLFWCFHC